MALFTTHSLNNPCKYIKYKKINQKKKLTFVDEILIINLDFNQ